jgi:hypothetical protein
MSTIQRVPAINDWLLEDYATAIGAEEGFNERADVIIAADGTDLNSFWAEVQETVRLRNIDRNRLIDSLSFRVSGVTEEVQPPQEVDFELASEYGQPQGIRTAATRLWRGYDFKFYDLAIRYTWMFLAEADQAQLRQLNNLALEADTKLVYQRVMKTIFNPLNQTGFTDKNEPVTVYKFYNGDAEVPPTYNYTTFTAPHNHYTVSGTAAVTSANVDTLQTQLTEHGYDLVSGYKLVLWVNKAEADIIRNFRTATGAKFDFVANPAYYGGAVWVPNNGQYVGGPAGTLENEIGTYGSFHVVQEGLIPAGYMVGIATGGQNNISNPVGLREHSNPAYRGLKLIPGQRSDYPLVDSFYRRGIGSGIRHRGAGAVMQIKVAAGYVTPPAYV